MHDAPRSAKRAPSAPALAVLACAFAAALLIVDAVFVHTTLGQRLDNAALLGRAGVPEDLVENAWSVLDTVSMLSLLGAGSLIGAIGLLRRRPAVVWSAGAVLVGANLSTQVLKHVVFTRPQLLGDGVKAYNTLPSGHATAALSVAAALVLAVPRNRRALAAWLGAGYGAAVGISTMVAGWHRPSDAVAAWLVVGVWTSAVAAVLAAGRRGPPDEARIERREVVLWIGAVVGLLLTAAGGFVLGLVVIGSGAGEIVGLGARSLAFLTAAAGVAASALTVMATLVTGIGPVDPAR